MVVDHIGGNHLEETEQSFLVPELEVAEDAGAIRTQLQVSVLDQVVDPRGVSPTEGGSQHDRRNDRVRPVYKFFPSRGFTCFDACSDQRLSGSRCVEHQYYQRNFITWPMNAQQPQISFLMGAKGSDGLCRCC